MNYITTFVVVLDFRRYINTAYKLLCFKLPPLTINAAKPITNKVSEL